MDRALEIPTQEDDESKLPAQDTRQEASKAGGDDADDLARDSTNTVRELAWTDVLGAHILATDGEHVDAPLAAVAGSAAATYLQGVFACSAKHLRKGKRALKKWRLLELKKRRLLELFFQFRGEQMADVEQLHRWITSYHADPRSASQRRKAQSVVALTPEEGVQTYENKVAPVFQYAGIDANVQGQEKGGGAERDRHARIQGNALHAIDIASVRNSQNDAMDSFVPLDDGYNDITHMDANECARSALVPMLLARDGARPARTSRASPELFPGPALESQVHRGLSHVLTLPRMLESDDSGS
ncbi:hypothetical protein PybrP1_011979 [[Pythium] brassicae (nom. inval.)]|nr:hypothetical protein PybrP1_011979 [[Pythium] brassicae (nom. inval.)]